jgi:diketogulonate reductase-like aldo/keto reductase
MVNQIRLCPGDTHMPTIDYCREHGILLEAYSPLGTGALLGLPARCGACGEEKTRPTAQILIRWSLQSGFLPLPKSVTKERIISNTDVFDFTLSNEEMALVGSLSVEGLAFRDPDDRPF